MMWDGPKGFEGLQSSLDRAVDRGVAYLRTQQLRDGEFPSVVAPQRDMGGIAAPDTNYFATPQVLWSLGFVFHRRTVAPMRAKAASFVAAGCESGVWRFYAPKVRRKSDPDANTTACAAAAIAAFDIAFDSRETIVALVSAQDEQRRFVRWIRSTESKDVDAVVNANVLWLLGAHPATRDAARWITGVIERGCELTELPYYPSPLSLTYAASRALYTGALALADARDSMLRVIEASAERERGYDNALDAALACCSLHNLGASSSSLAHRTVDALIGAQRRDGSWPDCAALCGPELPLPRSLWWGGAAYCTAVAVEALARATVQARSDAGRPVMISASLSSAS